MHTQVDTEVRAIMQFDEESETWFYYLNNVEITVDQWDALKLPIQQPDPKINGGRGSL